jgi:hypothetical protein
MRDRRSYGRLVWNDNYVADTEETELIRTAIVERGLCGVDAVGRFVGEELFNRDTRATIPTAGFGIVRHWYVADIKRLLKRLEGIAVNTEPPR